jgi:hypothetical protein
MSNPEKKPGQLVRLSEKLQMLNKLVLEGASMDWVIDIFFTTVVLAQDGVNDEFALN